MLPRFSETGLPGGVEKICGGTVCGLAPGGRGRPAICKCHRLPTPDEVIVGLGLAVVFRAVGGGHVFQYYVYRDKSRRFTVNKLLTVPAMMPATSL